MQLRVKEQDLVEIADAHLTVCQWKIEVLKLLRTGKTTNILTLIFVLLVSVVERSDAVSCYDCQYGSLQPQEASCTEPFSAASAPTCNGSACLFQYNGISGQRNYNLVDRNCTDQYTFQLDQCLTYSAKYNLVNFTFFTYGNSCCYSISGTSDGLKIQTIACECQADNCNGDLPHQIPNASFSPQAITELSIVVVATIAVLSIISWYIII